MFQEETKRAVWNIGFLVAVAIGILAFFQGLSDYVAGPLMTAEYISRLPAFYNNCYDAFIWAQRGLIGLIAPLIAVLPFSDSYLLDRSSGFLRSLLSRVSYKRYLFTKYCAAALSGGIALELPMILFFLVTNIAFPRGLNSNVLEQRILSSPAALGPFGNLYQSNPDLYIFSLIGLGFLFGAVYAILGLAISVFVENRYVVLATPFVLYIIAHYLLSLFNVPAWSPVSAFVPHWLIGVTWIHIGVSLGGIFLISSLTFYLGALQKEVRA
jgi:hypothetical protein